MQNVFHRPLNSAPVTCLSTPCRSSSAMPPMLVRAGNLSGANKDCSCNFVKRGLSTIRFGHITCTYSILAAEPEWPIPHHVK
ncbi:hypothetical protein [Sideroxydans sp. CL21]|uniref:hypothetical protein n=1 Tax=Sideroxydans sp. CL21 TaxID=2600596 RepID=UPI0024BCA089|nr:hypothetical protein [Sideroxydans sp. CL21]